MSFWITHPDGSMESATDAGAAADLLGELAAADMEHPDVAISHASGWTLSVFKGGLCVWENVEADPNPHHLRGVPDAEALRLMELVALGDIDEVQTAAWIPGYGHPAPPSPGCHDT